MTQFTKQDDKTIKCTFCDNQADIYATYDLHGINAYYIRCEPCNFKMELDRRYWNQIQTKEA